MNEPSRYNPRDRSEGAMYKSGSGKWVERRHLKDVADRIVELEAELKEAKVLIEFQSLIKKSMEG